jgi:hypothetical protein
MTFSSFPFICLFVFFFVVVIVGFYCLRLVVNAGLEVQPQLRTELVIAF